MEAYAGWCRLAVLQQQEMGSHMLKQLLQGASPSLGPPPAGGNQTRYVACVDAAGVVADEQLCVASAHPADMQACALQPCDFCSANDCFGKGTCSNGACVCDASQNVTGPFCQVRASRGYSTGMGAGGGTLGCVRQQAA